MSPPRRRLAWMGCLLGLALLAPPPATGAELPPFVGAGLTVEFPVDARDLQLRYPGSDPDPGDTPATMLEACREVDKFTIDPDGQWFRFREEQTETACGEARLQVAIPGGATRMQVSFGADRFIVRTYEQVPVPVNITQQLRLYDESDALYATFDYYDQTSGSSSHANPIALSATVVANDTLAYIGWFFYDRGENLGQGPGAVFFGQTFSATVRDAVVSFAGIPVTPSFVDVDREEVAGDVAVDSTTIGIPVERQPSGGRSGLEVQTSAALSLARIVGPDGRVIPPSAVRTTEELGVRHVTVDGELVQAHGFGEYTFFFLSTSSLEATPVLVPFAGAFLVLPAVLGAVATRQGMLFRRQAAEVYARAARPYWGLLAFFGLLYAGVLLWLLGTQRLLLMVAWPLQAEAAMLYVILAVCVAAFFVLAFLWRGRLVQAVQEDLSDKRRMNLELDRSNRELAQFAYVASHDLREPLRAVAGYAELVQRRYGPRLDDEGREFLGYTVEGARRMQALVDDLLAYSRVGTQGKALKPTAVKACLDVALRNLQVTIKESGAQITSDAMPRVLADDGQLVQLLQNLLSNALKFRMAGRRPRIHVGALPGSGGTWNIWVQDNGIGIEPQHVDRIFVIFQRLHTRQEYPGTGIGLALCKKIIERHGGRIWVESQPGAGSRFVFTLPAAPEAAPKAAHSRAARSKA